MLYVDEYASSFGRTGDEALEAARQATAKALAIDGDDFLANLALTRVQFFDGDPAFRESIDRTIALRPNSAQALAQGGFLLVISGDPAQGLALAEKARELTKAPLGFYHLTHAASYLRERRFGDALASAAEGRRAELGLRAGRPCGRGGAQRASRRRARRRRADSRAVSRVRNRRAEGLRALAFRRGVLRRVGQWASRRRARARGSNAALSGG